MGKGIAGRQILWLVYCHFARATQGVVAWTLQDLINLRFNDFAKTEGFL